MTQRKCANCGQVGHIKTNKKSVRNSKCPFCNVNFDRAPTGFAGAVLGGEAEEW